MNYEECLNKIHGFRRFGAQPDLSRIRRLLDGLGNPEKRLRFIHIAGTNGKGSTCAFCESALRYKGLKTGLFTSPYLEDFRERIQIQGVPISEEELITFARPVIEMAGSAEDAPTEFDVVTAIAMSYFADSGAEIVVLEVGLGGRHDPTNSIPVPAAAVITHIALDHTRQLGETVEKIAREKSGIVKEGGTVILSYGQDESAVSVVKDECGQKKASLIIAGEPDIIKSGINGSLFEYKGRAYNISLIGKHQVQNAVSAIETLGTLGLGYEEIAEGLRRAEWKGRLEVISRSPTVIIDSAHNPDGMYALKDALLSIGKSGRIITIMSVMGDKDWRKCVDIIAPISEAFYAVPMEGPRALDHVELIGYAGKFCTDTGAFPSFEQALTAAKEICGPEDIIIVCGSVAFAGQARKSLQSR